MLKFSTKAKSGAWIQIHMPEHMKQRLLWREYAAQQWELRKRVIPS